MERELELATEIQQRFQPDGPPTVEGYDFQGVSFSCYEIGGDYYDFIPRHNGKLMVALGDVSGKGTSASLLMSSLHAIFQSLIPLGLGLEEMMARANHLLVESSPANQFATLVFGKAANDGALEIVNAGHLPPILIKKGIAGELNHAGLPLGMFAETHFTSSRVQVDRGDSLLLFTDGVTESVNELGTEYGTCRLFEAVSGNGWKEPGALLRKCLDHLTSHCGSAKRSDDLTMLALAFN
jgi:sigma-B regulation protein RsbU (phosphoserine phosphatase)